MTTDHETLINALIYNGVEEIRRLIAAGAGINARDLRGETLLSKAIVLMAPSEFATDPAPWLALIASLIDMGADPTLLDDEGMGTLISPIFEQSCEMLELLLSRGVDPNRGCGDPWETAYDAAVFDYRYEAFMTGPPAPEEPTRPAEADEDAWLRQLDLYAQKQDLARPCLLLALRRHGALSGREMARKLGGGDGDRIVWRNDRWHLDIGH